MTSETVHRSVRFVIVIVAAAMLAASGVLLPAREAIAADEVATDDAGGPDGGTESLAPAAPVPAIELSGGVAAALPSSSEASTNWRYGRDGAGRRIDEISSRLRISGSGRTSEGMAVDFSVTLVVPTLRPATYSTAREAKEPVVAAFDVLASVWARRERGAANPDIVWEAEAPAGLKVELTYVSEASHTSERRGGVTVDVTRSRVHGTLEVTLPCVRSQAAARAGCRPETLRGTF